MAEEQITAESLPASPLRKNASPFSSSFRFLQFDDHQDSSLTPGNHFELDESDVIWSAGLCPELFSASGDSPALSSTDGGGSLPNSPTSGRRRPFLLEKYGLSAALAEDRVSPVQQCRAAINVPLRREVAVEVSKVFHQSAPLNVPSWQRGRRQPALALAKVEDACEDHEAVEDMLPPHLIVARSHEMAFSVFEGVGRTLKGRDLRRLRNAVFQKTGFLD
ncbi:hypothetical protein HPP92_007397 [Vanilla planifolia]|uniref:Senescence regulator n=1 Tax=Vanilla planifolia TaxID=51239 RepID=A0A835RA32_VANPL|nr:hypothetical protein HPP92_007397 [Vanilla planifolia]